MKVRVLLVEDHRMVREALRDVLIRDADVEVVGEAGNARDALELARTAKPDVVVLDINLPDLNGVEVAARLKESGNRARIIVLSAFADKRFVKAMLRAGACAYVTKSAAGTELVRAIRAVAAGHGYFSPEVAGTVATEIHNQSPAGDAPILTRREGEVLRLIAEGVRSPSIGEQLHVSVATVEVHRRNIMRKLGLHTVADLPQYAIREGIVPL